MAKDEFAGAKELSDALNEINEIIHSTREADMITDGAVEARHSEEMFGEESLLELVRESTAGPADLPVRLFETITAFTKDVFRDDVAILALSPK